MFDKLLIGKEIKVLSALDRTLVSREGTIVDETKNTFVVRPISGKLVRISKNIVRFRVNDTENDRVSVIEGNAVLGTPVERIRG